MFELKVCKQYSDKLLTKAGSYSFINLASVSNAIKLRDDEVNYFCDGFLLSSLISLLTLEKVQRVSFDFTSIADDVFRYCEEEQLTILMIGASEEEALKFNNKIQTRYSKLKLSVRNGYFDKLERSSLIESIANSNYDLVILGLGAGLQDEFAKDLRLSGYNGITFTCGGFIRQESVDSQEYYPRIINMLGLRAFYRMYKEPHTIIRYLIDYPVNLIQILLKKHLLKFDLK